MKTSSILSAVSALLLPILLSAQPTVSSVTAQQRAGTKLVDISYNLSISGGGTADVTLKASKDGGGTFETVPTASLSGAVGDGQSSGTGRTIVWDAGAGDWEAALYPSVQVEVIATTSGGVSPGEMVEVEGGTLATSNDLDGTEVDTFDIGKYEVTWGEWKAVRTWAAANGYDIGSRGAGCADDHPVRSVAWYDVVKWCNAKSEMEGLTPVYSYNGSTYKETQPSHTSISQNLSAGGYRLPQEMEWEFAARGGNQTRGYTYAGANDLDELKEVAWYRHNSGGAACDLYQGRGTWPVGQKAANELGLYDMSGNVWEWCWDQSGSYRRIRGGSWRDYANYCTVSYRNYDCPDYRVNYYGFRLARSSGQ